VTASPEATIPTSRFAAGNVTAVSIVIPTSIPSEPVPTTSGGVTMTTTSPAVLTVASTPTQPSSSNAGGSGSETASAPGAAQFTGGAGPASYGPGLYFAGTIFGLLAGFVL
jgi:hypothetical protein